MSEKEIKFIFKSKEKAEAFMNVFCNSGEQEYWESCDAINAPVAKIFCYDWKDRTVYEEYEN